MITAPERPGRCWPTMHGTDPWSIYLELCRTERLSETEVEVGQRRQLTELLGHAVKHVPYYERMGIDPQSPLHELPILTRESLRAHFEEMTPRRLPTGMRQTGASYTSGSTGEPVAVNWTSVQGAWVEALTLRYLDWAQVRQKHTLAAIRYVDTTNWDPKWREAMRTVGARSTNWQLGDGVMFESGDSYMLDISQDPESQYDWLVNHEPDYVLTYPTNLLHLAGIARRRGFRIPRLKKIITMCEPLTERDRDEIQWVLKAPVYDVYSCKELGCIASQCSCGSYHVHGENVIVEILDDADQPCEPGEEGRVVLTGLQTFATPLIRYDIGDRATMPPVKSFCERVKGLQSLRSISGRAIPSFLLPDGSRKSAMELAALVRRSGGSWVRRYAVQQTAVDSVTVQIVPVPVFDHDRSACTAALESGIREFFGTEQVKITLQFCAEMPLLESGKALPTLSTRV